MTDQGFNRGKHLLAGGARFSRAPGLLARLVAPGLAHLTDRIDAGLEKGTMIAHLPGGITRHLGGRAPGFTTELTIHDWRAPSTATPARARGAISRRIMTWATTSTPNGSIPA